MVQSHDSMKQAIQPIAVQGRRASIGKTVQKNGLNHSSHAMAPTQFFPSWFLTEKLKSRHEPPMWCARASLGLPAIGNQ